MGPIRTSTNAPTVHQKLRIVLFLRMDSIVSVLLFGITRDLTGKSAVSVTLPEGSQVADLLQQLYRQYPALTGIRSLLVAVNGEYAEPNQLLARQDEIALIPPVSGG